MSEFNYAEIAEEVEKAGGPRVSLQRMVLAYFLDWVTDPDSEITSRRHNAMLEEIKRRYPEWPDMVKPPDLGIHIQDGVKGKSKIGG